MRLRIGWINLLLLVLVLALAALVWFEPGLRDGGVPRTLTSVDPLGVQSLRILARGKPAVELEKSNGVWTLTSPLVAPAKVKPVQALLQIAAQPSLGRFPASEVDLKPFGLANSGLRLRLDDHELVFGTTDPVHFRRYVLFEDQVHLIEDRAYHHLLAGPETLADTPPDEAQP